MTAHYWHTHTHVHMQRVLLISFLIISAFVGSESSISSDELSRTALFGVRGGAFFGKKFGRRQSSNSGGGDDDDDHNNRNNNSNGSSKRFPPMSQDEIEEKLNIPIVSATLFYYSPPYLLLQVPLITLDIYLYFYCIHLVWTH